MTDEEIISNQYNKPMKELMLDNIISSRNFFINNLTRKIQESEDNLEVKLKIKLNDEYKHILQNDNIRSNKYGDRPMFRKEAKSDDIEITNVNINKDDLLGKKKQREAGDIAHKETSLANYEEKVNKQMVNTSLNNIPDKYKINTEDEKNNNLVLSLYKNENHISFRRNKLVTPEWHAPWKLYRVISGHTGWVRCIDVDPTNNWFVTGSNDRVIKFWDLATGRLKLSLTGHINAVRSVKVSARHPYLFSCGEDKQIKCWDLEQNKVVRQYHGHLSGVYALALHPSLDILVSGGRDCVLRMWDMRSKNEIYRMEGHNNAIAAIQTQEFNPQIISGSHDATIKLWDITAGKCLNTLTHHKKSIRSLIMHDEEYSFISGKIIF
jgi:pleiotropic regulator 1